MDPLRLDELATASGGQLLAADPEAICLRVTTDSRDVRTGDVFWALRGVRFDGHDFACEAIQRGARAVVCQTDHSGAIDAPRIIVDDSLAALGQFAHWYRMRQEALVIGVTGSVGKTTTKDLIHAALGRQFHGVCSPGNFNNSIGVPKSLLAIERQHEFAVLEMGARRAGEIRLLAEMARPEIGVITSLGKSHLATFGSLEGVRQAKGELFEALPPGGIAVLPGDDAFVRGLAERAACRVLFVGEQAHNHVRAESVAAKGQELSFRVGGDYFCVPNAGRHLLINTLIAVAIAREIGVPAETIAAGLRDFVPAQGRCRVAVVKPWTVIDDTYNASPASVAAACDVLRTWPAARDHRRYLVLGDMLELGATSAAEHREAGRQAAQSGIDGVLAFGEFAAEVACGASGHGIRPGRLVATDHLDVLLTMLDCWLEPGDIVLVKGSRGMQMERVVTWLQEAAARVEPLSPRRCA